jgi:hypothetical protein
MEDNLSFYESFYYKIITENIQENNIILLFIDNKINLIETMSYIIKKFNLNIYIIINNNLIYNDISKSIKGEECEKKIQIYSSITDINNIFFNKIFIFHIYSLNYFNDILNSLYNFSNFNTKFYIYCSLSNDNINKLNFKNYIRNSIMNSINCKIGYIINYLDFINNLNNNKNFIIYSIKIYKKNTYLIYGKNTVYEIILSLNN